MNVEILQVGQEKTSACLAIARDLPRFFGHASLLQMGRDLREHQVFIARDGEELLGFLTLVPEHPKVVELSWLAVKEDLQGQGIGRLLVRQVARMLKEQGLSLMKVKALSEDVTYAPFDTTRAFYEKLGFLPVEEVSFGQPGESKNAYVVYVLVLDECKESVVFK